ncbi:MAG: LysW-gamma-L-alpha-aminoadipyl-6-phosphate/LysW-L-glutamyl-5-phosphate reductase [Chloroflexota bacterium]|nr:LysW-gamma-L-alpha-aminoadipyl-6-phosphate/LysW-L-glutamyl-5-phosphate reductase [Chloroflexota bacterium]
MIRAALVGGAGYAGGEVLRLLAGHPEVEIVQVTSERLAGKPGASVHPPVRGRSDLRFSARETLGPADVVVSAMGHGESSQAIEQLRAAAPVCIDLGADFRLRNPADYPLWYGWTHPLPELLGGAIYGLAELHRPEIGGASLIAAGGCLATASILGLAPLACAGVLDALIPIVVEAKVGSSAGGSQPSDATHHAHRSGELRSYAPTGHRHTAEIVQELHLGADAPQLAFSATAVEAVRGVLVTAHAFLSRELDDRDLWELYRSRYASEPFVRIVKARSGLHRSPNPKLLTGTNYCDVSFERDPHSRRVVVTAALDNLVKGSAGQAVQALNVRHGFPETLGLEFAGLYPI